MRVKTSFFIYICVLRIQLGCISDTSTIIPDPFTNTNDSTINNSTANITFVDMKLPEYLTEDRIKELHLKYNWTEALDRTGILKKSGYRFTEK